MRDFIARFRLALRSFWHVLLICDVPIEVLNDIRLLREGEPEPPPPNCRVVYRTREGVEQEYSGLDVKLAKEALNRGRLLIYDPDSEVEAVRMFTDEQLRGSWGDWSLPEVRRR